MTDTNTKLLRIGHSPDPDDAFMWYPLAVIGNDGPKVDCGAYSFEHILQDIETLNHRSEKGELEITALSIHQYAYVADKYALTACGSSMGDGYGPMVVAREPYAIEDIKNLHIAIPGTRTTAFLALELLMREMGTDRAHNYEVVPFDEIIDQVANGTKFDAGLIIHEGQLTFANAGLERVVDLGEWWGNTRGLPLPLGGNAIRRDFADEFGPICSILKASIDYALEHREEALNYALNYARDMGVELADEFVGMYVNDYTLDYGDKGRAAVAKLLSEAADAGLIPAVGEVDFIEPG
ncbi:MAG: ABC transporter substrate-binding protein [Phycisphaera sp.]|nr:ABC transporter substrate-binding protein [Phycisphaera sp.]